MAWARLSILFLAAFLLSSHRSHAESLTIDIPSTDSAVPVSPSLFSLSIEGDRFLDWSTNNATLPTSRNQFFYNAFENLRSLTGVPPGIRIGANSEDHTIYSGAVPYAQDIFPEPNAINPYPEATNITVGDGYYASSRYLLPGTEVIWGVNLGKQNLTAAVLEAASIIRAFSEMEHGITLKYLEIGNEPDLYMNNGLRARSYNVTDYINEWTEFANAILENINVAETSTRFLAGAFAGSSHKAEGFSPQAIYNQGILNSTAGHYIEAFSEHHYSGTFCSGSPGVLAALMNKATIRSNISQYIPDVQATDNQGLDYIFGETNSYSCHGAPGVSNVAASAIWALDYSLFAATIGIRQIYFHDGIGFKYNLLQPITLTRSILDGSTLTSPLPPHIQPQYYAAIVGAEAIGRWNSEISELSIDHDQISGYAFYEDCEVKKLLLINHTPYLQSDATIGTIRPVVDVQINFPEECDTWNIQVKTLNIQHSDDTSGITWGGQTYETSDALISGEVTLQAMSSNEYLGVPASQAVLVTFQCAA